MYLDGQGMAVDQVAALSWFLVALERGNTGARHMVEVLRSEMTADATARSVPAAQATLRRIEAQRTGESRRTAAARSANPRGRNRLGYRGPARRASSGAPADHSGLITPDRAA